MRTNRPVLQANILTSSKTDLTRDQRRVLYLFLRHVHQHGWPEGGRLGIKSKDYAATFSLSDTEARDDLRRAVNGFSNKVVWVYENDESWEGEQVEIDYNWSTSRRRNHKRGEYAVTFNPELRPMLQPLAEDLPFTVMDLQDLACLQGKWSLRLYESICQFKSTGKWMIRWDTLAERWDLPPSYRAKWRYMETRVFEPALEEIRTKTPFTDLDYMVKRNARGRVESVIFTFTKQDKN